MPLALSTLWFLTVSTVLFLSVPSFLRSSLSLSLLTSRPCILPFFLLLRVESGTQYWGSHVHGGNTPLFPSASNAMAEWLCQTLSLGSVVAMVMLPQPPANSSRSARGWGCFAREFFSCPLPSEPQAARFHPCSLCAHLPSPGVDRRTRPPAPVSLVLALEASLARCRPSLGKHHLPGSWEGSVLRNAAENLEWFPPGWLPAPHVREEPSPFPCPSHGRLLSVPWE